MQSLACRLRIAAVYALLSTSLTLARNPKKGVSFSGAQSCKSLEVHTDSSWWYTWGTNAGFAGNLRNFCQNDNGAAAAAARADGMDFVPMFWNSVPSTIDAELQAELEAATYLMTFNEPERGDQANLTPAQAAALWPQIENIADTYGLSIVGPCMTKDAYDWYDDFLAACTNCRIDYTCIHTYYQPWPCDGSKDWECIGNADLGNDYWLRVTLDRWFDDYGKPIWVTEYGCYPWDAAGEGCDANKHSAILEQQTSVFEEDSRVFRYNWFTTYAFDEGGFKDGALNVPNYEEVGPGQACPNIKWIAGIFETRGWGIHEYHECVTIADNDVECHKPVRLSIDDESCYCSRDSCDTTVSSYGAMDTYKELELLPSRDESELSDMGDEYNDFGSVTDSPSVGVSDSPSAIVSNTPSAVISNSPSAVMSNPPSALVSNTPSTSVSDIPSVIVSNIPSAIISNSPSAAMSNPPSALVSNTPSTLVSDIPSVIVSNLPSVTLSNLPSSSISNVPSDMVSYAPSISISSSPSNILSSSPSEANSGPSLNSPWFIDLFGSQNITDGYLSIAYKARNATYEVKVYKEDCETPTDVFSVLSKSIPLDNGEMILEADLTVDIDAIIASDLYTGNGITGFVTFCVEASLWSSVNKVVAHETVFTADVDAVEGFFTLQDVSLYEDNPTEINNIDLGYEGQVLVYQCDPISLVDIGQPSPLSAGNELTVCVENNVTSAVVTSILEMTLVQSSGGLNFEYGVITNGEVVSSNAALIESECDNGICYASIVLIDAFFQDGTTTLDVIGEALLGSGKEEDANPFSLSVDLKSCNGGLISTVIKAIFG